MRTYSQCLTHMVGSSYTSPAWEFVVVSPPFLGLPLDHPPHTSSTASRNNRTASCPFLVGWHQAEFTSCPQPRHSQDYAPVPPWWASVEVPYGVMVELPPFQAYISGDSLDRDDFAVKVLRSEWAFMAGDYLVESFLMRGIMWLYLKALRSSIFRVGSRAICRGPAGPDERDTEELGALLALLEKLPVGPTLTQCLCRVPSERRDRSFRLSVVGTTDGSVMEAKEDEDPLPLQLPHFADVLEGRALAAVELEWVQEFRSSRPADRGSSGVEKAGSSIPSVSYMLTNEGHPPSTTGPRIVTVSFTTHRDIQEHTLDALWRAPPSAFHEVLVPFLGPDQREVHRPHIGSLLAALLHTFFRRGEAVRSWTEEQVGISTHGAAEFLDRFGRDALREVVFREVDTAKAGYFRRGRTGDASALGQVSLREIELEADKGRPTHSYRAGGPSL